MIAVPNVVYSDSVYDLVYYQIIDIETGEILWSENKEEQATIEEKKRVALLQKVVERMNAKFAEHDIEGGISANYRDLILETKLEEE